MIVRRPTRRPTLAWPTVVVFLIGLASCGTGASTAARVAYDANDLRSGEPVELADLDGSVVLLSGWATWCAPCRAELPKLDDLYAARRDDGLVVIAVNLDAAGPSTRDVLPIVDQMGLTMPTWIDTENDFAIVFGTASMPANILIDRGGVVRARWEGAIDPDDADIAVRIDELLAAESS